MFVPCLKDNSPKLEKGVSRISLTDTILPGLSHHVSQDTHHLVNWKKNHILFFKQELHNMYLVPPNALWWQGREGHHKTDQKKKEKEIQTTPSAVFSAKFFWLTHSWINSHMDSST